MPRPPPRGCTRGSLRSHPRHHDASRSRGCVHPMDPAWPGRPSRPASSRAMRRSAAPAAAIVDRGQQALLARDVIDHRRRGGAGVRRAFERQAQQGGGRRASLNGIGRAPRNLRGDQPFIGRFYRSPREQAVPGRNLRSGAPPVSPAGGPRPRRPRAGGERRPTEMICAIGPAQRAVEHVPGVGDDRQQRGGEVIWMTIAVRRTSRRPCSSLRSTYIWARSSPRSRRRCRSRCRRSRTACRGPPTPRR